MFIGYFTERPYQDPRSGYFGATGKPIMDLTVSNEIYDAWRASPERAAAMAGAEELWAQPPQSERFDVVG